MSKRSRSLWIADMLGPAAYDIGRGDPDLAEDRMSPVQLERLAAAQARAGKEFEDLQKLLPAYPPRARTMLEAALRNRLPARDGETPPDLDGEQVDQAFRLKSELQVAVAERERFRFEKARLVTRRGSAAS